MNKQFLFSKVDHVNENVYLTIEQALHNQKQIPDVGKSYDLFDYKENLYTNFVIDLPAGHDFYDYDVIPSISVGDIILEYSRIQFLMDKAICRLENGISTFNSEKTKELIAASIHVDKEVSCHGDHDYGVGPEILNPHLFKTYYKRYNLNFVKFLNSNPYYLEAYRNKAFEKSMSSTNIRIIDVEIPSDVFAELLEVASDLDPVGNYDYDDNFVLSKEARQNSILGYLASNHISGKSLDECISLTAKRFGLTEEKVGFMSQLIVV